MNSAIPNFSKTLFTEASERLASGHPHEALLWALGAYLDPAAAQEAAWLWQPPASNQGSVLVGLSRYCRLVARQFNLQGKEAELHLRIIRGMQARGLDARHALRPSEEDASTRGKAEPSLSHVASHSANDSLPPGLPGMMVQRFLEAVEQVVARECPQNYTPQLWRQRLLRHGQSLPKAMSPHVADWLWGRTSSLLGDWPAQGVGTRLINVAYVTLAEYLGPVRADACFTHIVRDFENSQDPVVSTVRSYL